MSHTCHAPDCNTEVPPKMFMCKKHWFTLRKPIRDAIWQEYRSGQEVSKKPTFRYLAVQQLAIAEFVFRKNDERAAAQAAPYAMSAQTWREKAIAAGDGDPLEGLVSNMTARQRSFDWGSS
jgi:hypothetical protein